MALLATRIVGPSDLYDKQQPPTTAGTADVVLNGHWFLPYDASGGPAPLPPLYNWLSAPGVALFGFREWVLRLPSTLASLAVLGTILAFARWIQEQSAPPVALNLLGQALPDPTAAINLPLLAALLWLANIMTSSFLYAAQPDMLLTAFLCGAWWSATLLITSPTPRRGTAVAFWLCLAGAALARGPMALLPLVYLPLAAILLRGTFNPPKPGDEWLALRQAIKESWSQARWAFQRSGWWWGLPLAALPCLIWAALAWRQDPDFFRILFSDSQPADHATVPPGIIETLCSAPLYMISCYLPCSLGVLAMLWWIPPRRWFKHALTPALIWVLLIFLTFLFATTRQPDCFLPIYPAMALITAWCLREAARRLAAESVRPAMAGAAVLIGAIFAGLGAYNLFFSEAALNGWGTHVTQFSQAIAQRIGKDPVLFLDSAGTPLQTLMRRAQHGAPPIELQRTALWAIHAYEKGSPAVLVSEPLRDVAGVDEGRLGLYRLHAGEGVEAYKNSQARLRRRASFVHSFEETPADHGP